MPNYVITESVGDTVEQVNSYADLEKHHPSSGLEDGRDYLTINRKLEEVRLNRPEPHVKKDFIIDPPTIPAPVSGTIRNLNDDYNTMSAVPARCMRTLKRPRPYSSATLTTSPAAVFNPMVRPSPILRSTPIRWPMACCVATNRAPQ